MNHRVLGVILGLITVASAGCGGGSPTQSTPDEPTDHRAALRSTLQTLADQSSDPLLKLHFRSIGQVIDAGDRRTTQDTEAIGRIWSSFSDASTPHSPRLPETYLNRARPLIIAWTSPTDGQVSFAWLTLPARWNVEQEYPLYVQLHGLWDVAQDRVPYLAYPFSNPGTSFAFEDGYLVSPWGRGNLWYRGISETDIWEGIAAVKALVRVDANRQYLCGHSMGGYGAWRIAARSANLWAALGVQAGAFAYDTGELDPAIAGGLGAVPTYFVVGTYDGLLAVNQVAWSRLRDAGNTHLSFITFAGGHDYRQSDVEQMYLWMRQFDLRGRQARGQDGASDPVE